MKILVCIDGEPHSRQAIQRAIALGVSRSAEVTALHIIDPWLKKFYNELYSQGRKEYLEYVDECLQAKAERVHREFDEMCLAEGLEAGFKVRHGEPVAEILEEVRHDAPDLLITGCKKLSAWGRFRSGNLPSRLRKKVGAQTAMISIGTADVRLAQQNRHPSPHRPSLRPRVNIGADPAPEAPADRSDCLANRRAHSPHTD